MRCDQDNGCALILGENTEIVDKILNGLFFNKDLANPVEISKNINAYAWNIKTKYYTTDISICTTINKPDSIHDPDFRDNIHAIICPFKSSLDDVKIWMPYIESCNAEVLILVCDTCTDSNLSGDLTKKKVLEWCIENHFELVELTPDEESDDESENDFKETLGVARIIEALHAHTWPNLVLTEKNNGCLKEENCDGKNPDAESSPDVQTGNEILNSENVGEDLLRSLASGDPDDQSFEELFQNFCQMKDKAASLPFEDRKKYAEQVAIQFWKAVGGDEDEISGLGDIDDS